MISIIIPIYNREKIIQRAIESVIRQGIEDIQIIAVDDGSTDNTAEVVKSIKDPRIKYIFQENGGVSKARNTGIRNSDGEFIAFLDSDDILKDWSLLYRFNFLKDNPEYDGIAGSVQQIKPNMEVYITKQIDDFKINLAKIRYDLSNAKSPSESSNYFKKYNIESKGGIPFTASSLMVRKDVFEKTGLYNEELRNSEDLEFFYRLTKNALIKYDFMRVFAFIQFQQNGLTKTIKKGEAKDEHSKALDIIKNYDGTILI